MMFCLKHLNYDYSSCRHYKGPDLSQPRFKALCDSLLPHAAKRCLEKQQSAEEPCGVYWDDVFEELDLMLQERGFDRLDVVEAEYAGWAIGATSNELLSADVVESVRKFNKRLEDDFHAEIEKHQFTS